MTQVILEGLGHVFSVPGIHDGQASFSRRPMKTNNLLKPGAATLELEAVPDGLGDVVDVLGLGDGLDVVLQDAREVVLQLRAPKVGQDLLPVWRALHTRLSQHYSTRPDISAM